MPDKSQRTAKAAMGAGASALGELPEWNLADLYPAMDAPELKRDLEQAAADAVAFESTLEGQARRRGGQGLPRPGLANAFANMRRWTS